VPSSRVPRRTRCAELASEETAPAPTRVCSPNQDRPDSRRFRPAKWLASNRPTEQRRASGSCCPARPAARMPLPGHYSSGSRRRPARQRRLASGAPACGHVTHGSWRDERSQGAVGWKERISSVPGRTTPAADSGTSFQAPGRSPSGSETTNRVSSPKPWRTSTSGWS
jgi:hypothetical protein